METGAGDYDQVALSRRIGTYTGGLSVTTLNTAVHPEGSSQESILDGNHLQSKLLLRGKATSDNIGELFDLMKIVLTDANFDSKSRLIEMLKETKAGMEAGIGAR